jgi:hypothetical protein
MKLIVCGVDEVDIKCFHLLRDEGQELARSLGYQVFFVGVPCNCVAVRPIT